MSELCGPTGRVCWPTIDETEWPSNLPDYHAVMSIQLIELINDGLLDFKKDKELAITTAPSNAIKGKFIDAFIDHYSYREIGVLPLKRWKLAYKRKANELMRKYGALIEQFEQGATMMQEADVYGKSREVYSDFPQAQLSNVNRDYATNGTDKEFEEVTNGSMINKLKELDGVNEPLTAMVEECETLFSQLFTVNINGFF